MIDELILMEGMLEELIEVIGALAPLLALLAVFQVFLIQLSWHEVYKALIGIVMAVVGFTLFLQGVYIAFMPAGQEIGAAIVEHPESWLLVPIGFVLGAVATSAEPAVRVLTYEVEEESNGAIRKSILLLTLALGVGVFVAVAMIRILIGFPLWWVLVPAYGIALIVAFFADQRFVSIAFDSGGVATGPMTVTFILAMAISVAGTLEGRDPFMEGFGLVALVALAPILSVLILGMIFRFKEKPE
ncbi:uncharacterized protein DUF1538 [Salsuginibacillus halophilus]|uniref:Uncharacterized protein DUF1538 n=1 Tax=Salsuginibacillus halophilus TaxID=517424 RepID=A0A2P8HXQ8_9BACI|nr:DUF1538 domain-containing protein [Salsuginibacillus halophilus]PSL50988.1 uncharacterized protein DUF1538 [Salsuginibacillus halophilus]